MNITKIYLSGYKPLLLNSIDTITIECVQQIQIILGTNGSGKSSLLRVANLLPATCQDFKDGGIKQIWAEHNGHSYEMISLLKNGGKHSFYRDGNEVLSMVPATVLREHINTEFNYTPLVHKLLIGELRFTEMTSAKRREILTLISPLDLQYALSLHTTLKEQIRDNQAILKHLTAKSSDAKAQLRELSIPEQAAEQKLLHEQQLARLIPYTQGQTATMNSVMAEIDQIYNQLGLLQNKLERFDSTRVLKSQITNIEELQDYIANRIGKATATQTHINHIAQEIEELRGVSGELGSNTLSTLDIQERIAMINAELTTCEGECYVRSDHGNYIETLTELNHGLDRVYDNVGAMVFYSAVERQELLAKNTNALQRVTQLNHRLENNLGRLANYKDNRLITNCPKCQFEFDVRGVSVSTTVANLESENVLIHQQLENLQQTLTKLVEPVADAYRFDTLVNELTVLKRGHHLPYEFWTELGNADSVLQNRAKTQNRILYWQHNIRRGEQRKRLLTELEHYQSTLAVINKYGKDVDLKLLALQDTMNHALVRKQRYDQQLSLSKQLLRNINLYTGYYQSGQTLLASLATKFQQATAICIQNDAKIHCEEIYGQLADSRSLLVTYDSLVTNIEDINTEYTALANKQKNLCLLEEHLSPNKGIIADQMLGFISSYIEQINLIIRDLWEYRLEINVCNMDNGVLDYEFPMQVEDSLVSDIKEGSTSQEDVINLAFTIVMMQYLNITDYPLYLDETGASFDEQHRSKLMDYIRTLIDTKHASQIFVVNHYSAMYGGLSNTDTVVLDPRNITVPDNYNANSTLTYLST